MSRSRLERHEKAKHEPNSTLCRDCFLKYAFGYKELQEKIVSLWDKIRMLEAKRDRYKLAAMGQYETPAEIKGIKKKKSSKPIPSAAGTMKAKDTSVGRIKTGATAAQRKQKAQGQGTRDTARGIAIPERSPTSMGEGRADVQDSGEEEEDAFKVVGVKLSMPPALGAPASPSKTAETSTPAPTQPVQTIGLVKPMLFDVLTSPGEKRGKQKGKSCGMDWQMQLGRIEHLQPTMPMPSASQAKGALGSSNTSQTGTKRATNLNTPSRVGAFSSPSNPRSSPSFSQLQQPAQKRARFVISDHESSGQDDNHVEA